MRLPGEVKLFLGIVVTLLAFVVLFVWLIGPEAKRCREAGGVQVQGQCIAKEVLR